MNRIQLQAFLGHADKRRVLSWLKDLREKHYIDWIYDPHDFAAKTKPAIYYLSSNSVRYLKALTQEDDTPLYPIEEIRKRYKEAARRPDFIARCLLIADCGLMLLATSSNNTRHRFLLAADYVQPDHSYHFLAEHEVLRPSLYIQKQRGDKVVTNYLLEIFDASLPRYRFRHRLKTYVQYLDEAEWESQTGHDDPPTILIVCPNLTELIYAKRSTRKLFLDTYYEIEDIPKNIHIRFTTTEQLEKQGITAELWEEGRKRVGL